MVYTADEAGKSIGISRQIRPPDHIPPPALAAFEIHKLDGAGLAAILHQRPRGDETVMLALATPQRHDARLFGQPP